MMALHVFHDDRCVQGMNRNPRFGFGWWGAWLSEVFPDPEEQHEIIAYPWGHGYLNFLESVFSDTVC